MSQFKNKTALVTGGGQGLGRAIALELANNGANIIVGDLNAENAKAVVSEIKAMGRKAVAYYLDVTDAATANDCVGHALNCFSRIDILVNNAGFAQRTLGNDSSDEDFDGCYDVNLKGVWTLVNALIPHFKQQGNGKIINIASIAGRRGVVEVPAYSASKAAVISLTQSLASRLGSDNITVNAVCPGSVWTPMFREHLKIANPSSSKELSDGEAQARLNEQVKDTIPTGRLSTPEDIAYAVAFFASAGANNITGQALNVDGGTVMN